MHRANVSAARSSAADGSGGPCKCRPAGCSFAQAFLAAWNAGKAGLGSAPFEPGSGKFGVPFARMQLAYVRACVPPDPVLLGLEEDPHAAIATALTASAAKSCAGCTVRSTVRGAGNTKVTRHHPEEHSRDRTKAELVLCIGRVSQFTRSRARRTTAVIRRASRHIQGVDPRAPMFVDRSTNATANGQGRRPALAARSVR